MDDRRPAMTSRRWRFGNALVSVLARVGVGPIQLLTTRGRCSGRPRTVPVVPVDHNGARWLVAPYGPVDWVHNVRADPHVTLRYGRSSVEYLAHEAEPTDAGPVLKEYVTVASKARSQFRASPDAPAAAFAVEAVDHPVFTLKPVALGD